MQLKSPPSPVEASSFGGLKRTCVKYKQVQVRSAAGVRNSLRCKDFAKASKVGRHPRCPSGLKDGGRSPGLIRRKHCTRQPRPRHMGPRRR